MKNTTQLVHFSSLYLAGVILQIGLLFIGIYPHLAQADTEVTKIKNYSLWGIPGKVEEYDSQPVEVGVKFRTDLDGSIDAVRFYRAVPVDSGYTVHIWSGTGELLGTGMAYEGQQPTPGWQTVQVYPAVTVKAGATYVASYYAKNGQYSASEGFFNNTTVSNGPLHALGDGVEGGNGVYLYAEGGGFPNQSYKACNYWVDVNFIPADSASLPN